MKLSSLKLGPIKCHSGRTPKTSKVKGESTQANQVVTLFFLAYDVVIL